MIQFENLSKEQRDHLSTIRLVWAMSCQCQCAECRAMFNELQRICGDGAVVESAVQPGCAE